MKKNSVLTKNLSGAITKSKQEKRKLPTSMNQEIKKVPLKAELLAKFNALQEEHEVLKKKNIALEEKNVKNMDTMNDLTRQLEKLKKVKDTKCIETQTETGLLLKCNECNFEGMNTRELSWHMSQNHGWPEEQKSVDLDSSQGVRYCIKCNHEAEDMYQLDMHMWTEHDEDAESNFTCNICDEVFDEIGELMHHKKDDHIDKVSICWQFAAGNCSFGNEKCWFLHEAESDSSPQYICNICERKFSTQSSFLSHKKKNHEHLVPKCTKESNGSCKYSNKKCWFRHADTIKENMKINENIEKESSDEAMEENKDVIQKIFKMMENFTEQIVKMKGKNNLQ